MLEYASVFGGIFFLLVLYVIWLKVIAPRTAGVKKITVDEYRSLFKKESHLLLDVRFESEFLAAHAPRAKHLTVEAIAKSNRQEMLDIVKEKPVVCVCKSGSRAMMAATIIARFGFKPVYVITGGMRAWKSAGLTIRRNKD
ncbi:MAG: rhodanese-like domain-containing protein [Mariprofundaceae bacterium]